MTQAKPELSSSSTEQQGSQMPSVILESSERGRPINPFAEWRTAQGHNVSEDRRHETQRPFVLSLPSFSLSLESAPPLPNYSHNSANGDLAVTRAPYAAPPRHQLKNSDPSQTKETSAAQYTIGADSHLHDHQERKRSLDLEEEAFAERQDGRKYKRHRGSKGKQAKKWDTMFQRLVDFKRIHGHCLVPNRYPSDPSLGAWVSTQRRHYKALIGDDDSVTTPMTPERASKLISIGFQWETKNPLHVPWEHRYQELLAYKEEYGDCVVPIGFKDNPRLSNWVSAQRQEYKLYRQGKKCRITASRVAALNAVEFVWEAKRGPSRQQQKRLKDAKVGKAVRQVLSLVAAAGQASNVSRITTQNAPQDLPSHILLNHVLSILEGQPLANGTMAAQRHVAAAERMKNAVARQRLNEILAPLLRAGIAHHLPPPHDQARASHCTRHLFQGATDDPEMVGMIQNQFLPDAVQEIITKHLVNALRKDYRANVMGMDTVVAKILGIARESNVALATPTREPTGDQPLQPAFLRIQPPASLKPQEASNEPPTNVKITTKSKSNVKASLVMNNVQGTKARDSAAGPPQGLEFHKRAAPPFCAESGQGGSTLTLSSSSARSSSIIDLPHASGKPSFSTDSHDHNSGGVFSDAEEDETAAAFLPCRYH